jgi:WD40 repeat protein
MTGHAGWVWSVAITADGVIASAGADGTVRLWDVHTAEPLEVPLVAHTDQVRAVCFLADSALASAGHDGTIRIWDVAARRLHSTLPLGVPVHALAYASNTDYVGNTLTVGTPSGIVDLTVDASLLPW